MTSKVRNILGNSVWQLMPSVFTLLLSLAVVRFFSTSAWGTIVSVTVIQQVINSIVAWGNKDFLQRDVAQNAGAFGMHFSGLFAERFGILLVLLPIVHLSGWIVRDYFLAFSLLIFGRFVQQSFDIAILKDRKFTLAIALECSFLTMQLLALMLIWQQNIGTIPVLLAVFWIPALFKGLILSMVFRRYFVLQKPQNLLLPKAFFFAMLSLTGLVHSKIDLLVVSRLLDAKTLGQYQIVMAFLWNIQSAAMYISGPYVHNFYRLGDASRQQYAQTLRKLGFVIVPLGVAAMAILLQFASHIAVSIEMILASLLFGMMSFVYLPWILRLNREGLENRVLLINVIGTVFLTIFLLAADRFFGLTLVSLLWIVTIQQLFLTAAAFAAHKTPKPCPS